MMDTIKLLNERAASYGALRQSSLTAVAMDCAAVELAAANAQVEELTAELVAKDADLAAVLADRDALWKALHDATSIIGHAVPMDTVVLAGRKLVAREVWQAAHDLLYPKAARTTLGSPVA